jgi:hypothetical protein
MQVDFLQIVAHDAFRYGGLNSSAGEVYWRLLLDGPLTAREISDRTGVSRPSVFRGLARMSRLVDEATGEMFNLVKKDGKQWRAFPDIDLEQVARIVGTAGKRERQKKQHEEERRKWRKYLGAIRERKNNVKNACFPPCGCQPKDSRQSCEEHEVLDRGGDRKQLF